LLHRGVCAGGPDPNGADHCTSHAIAAILRAFARPKSQLAFGQTGTAEAAGHGRIGMRLIL